MTVGFISTYALEVLFVPVWRLSYFGFPVVRIILHSPTVEQLVAPIKTHWGEKVVIPAHQFLSQGDEQLCCEGLGEDVSNLPVCRNVDDWDGVVANVLLEMVDFGANVFGTLRDLWRRRHGDGCLVVLVDFAFDGGFGL